MKLTNKVAIITGGAGGIGRAMAHEFLKEGARGVVISDLDPDQVKHVSDELGCSGFAADVTNES